MGLAMASLFLGGCQNSYDTPELTDPEATLTPNTTIAEFKIFMQETMSETGSDAVKVPKKEDGEDYIIHGRVISSDASGNIYRYLLIQDETSAINLSINGQNMWSHYRIGQDIVINVTDLYMGAYGGFYQIGWLGEYSGAASTSFLDPDIFELHSQLNGMPSSKDPKLVTMDGTWPSDQPYCVVLNSLSDITSLAPTSLSTDTKRGGLDMMGQLVEIQNVSFVDGGKEPFAPYHETVNRNITDGTNTLIVRNSGYSNFYNTMLPEGTGTVRGILSCYNSDWQILLRSADDVMFDDMPGFSQESALTVSEAIAQENNGRTLWTKGYIVGSVMATISNVTSNDDIIWGPDAEMANNIVIAESPEVSDYQECMVVKLDDETSIRKFVNLLDNPDRYGQLLYVKGTLDEYMGLNGIINANSDYSVEGVQIGGSDGAGTESSPYSVDYILNNQTELSNVWIEGYIVGYVMSENGVASFDNGAVFANYTSGDYNGTNVIISSGVSGATIYNSIPVSCDRATVGLKLNPGNYGKKVKFQGSTGAFLGAFGVKSTETSSWKIQ